MADDTELRMTEWNQNKATHFRIDEALRECRKASRDRNYWEWLKGLEACFLECECKMDQELQDHYHKQFNSLLHKYEKFRSTDPRDKHHIEMQIRKEYFKFEMEVRRFMNSRGMLMTDRRTSMENLIGGSSE